MSAADAQTARGMSQRIKAALPTIQNNFFNKNALLALIKLAGNIKYRGSHTEFDWYIRKEPTKGDPNWGGGDLAIRTFEEADPANMAKLPYCWIEKTYGVSDKTLEANRHAGGAQKVYDSLKENLIIAQINLYNSFGPAIYTGSGLGNNPSGIMLALGTPNESSSKVSVSAASAYANRTLNTTAVSAYAVEKASWDDPQFAPEVASIHEIPNVSTAPKWTVDAVEGLDYMCDEMAVTADLSGTGRMQKPNYAIMPRDPYHALRALLAGNQAQYSIPVGSKKLQLAGWANIAVNELLVVKDNNVPDDTNDYERVIVLDTTSLFICTTHTKKEGLIRTEFEPNLPLISGAIGVLKMNLNFMVKSPTAIGCILGCND